MKYKEIEQLCHDYGYGLKDELLNYTVARKLANGEKQNFIIEIRIFVNAKEECYIVDAAIVRKEHQDFRDLKLEKENLEIAFIEMENTIQIFQTKGIIVVPSYEDK